MIDELYMTAQEAASELGVSIDTLYSYVSRKQIRTQKIPGSRQRIYWRADIERAKKGSAKRAQPGLALTQDTDITLLTPSAPFYRGRNAIELAETFTLEQVAALLWQVEEGAAFSAYVPNLPDEVGAMAAMLATSTSTDKTIALLPFLEQANPRAFDMSHAGMCRTGADVLRWYTAILCDLDLPSADPIHLQVARHLNAPAEVADLIRRLLVLSADHGFGAGTYAVRAVASTGVTAYRSILAGFAIVSGRRSRLGRTDGIGRLLSELAAAPDPKAIVVRRLREGEPIPGFDSPSPYNGADPRAIAMLDALEKVYGTHPIFANARKAMLVVEEVLDLHPNFAFVNMLLTLLTGLERHKILYILGRCAGWVAHSIEQYQLGEIDSPYARYRGALPPV